MPATANAAQLAEVGYIDGLTVGGTVASQSFLDWKHGSNPASYDPASNSLRKWYNTPAGTARGATSAAGTGGGTVTYTFDPYSDFTTAQKQAYVAALTLWSDLANISFAENAGASPADVQFTLGRASGSYTTNGLAPPATVGSTAIPTEDPAAGQAVVTQDTGPNWGVIGSFTERAGSGVATTVHELGHLLGLGHAGPYDGAVTPATMQLGAYDSRQWSAMSYISPDDKTAKAFAAYEYQDTNWKLNSSTTTTSGGTTTTTTTTYQGAPTTPMMLDILAVQQLYGASTRTTFSGGQVFGFNSNISDAARPFYDFTQNTKPIVTIWDTGGANTLDLSGFATASVVNLNPGTFSSAAGLTNNIGIAFGTAVDTAVGGAGDDTFILNAGSDRIEGGGAPTRPSCPAAAPSTR